MYRSASRLLTRSLAAAGRRGRPLSTDLPAASPAEDTAFVEAWKKVSPNIEPPKTPLSFMKPRPPTPSSIPSKLTVNFVLPYRSEISSKEVVVHCDLKPGNVLLDEDMTAHVSDFGIAKLLLGNSSTVTSTNAPGTIGYMAPEYASTGRISRKGDVYSFGILLLEIFTRKKPTDPMFFGESSLRRWVCEARSTALLEIVDCNLLKDGSGNQMTGQDLTYMHACLSSIIELGIICSRDSPQERPSMKETVPRLQKIKMDHISMFPNA